jgi:hypothetical protein
MLRCLPKVLLLSKLSLLTVLGVTGDLTIRAPRGKNGAGSWLRKVSVDGLQKPKAQVARAAHTLSVCKRHLAHELLPLHHSTLHHHN